MPSAEQVCGRCAHPNDASALTCSACGAYLLVDLRVDETIPDPRRRYHAAKAIAAKGRPFPDITHATQALQVAGSILVPSMSRPAAAAAIEALAAVGVKARLTTAPLAPDSGAASATGTAEDGLLSAVGAGRAPRRFTRLSGLQILALGAAAVAAFFVLRAMLRPGSSSPEKTALKTEPAAASRASSSPPAVREIVGRALDATAMLRCRDTAGAGFFVAPEVLVTNHHVTCGSDEIQISMRNGRALTGTVIRVDPWLDLALVRARGAGAPALRLGDSTALAAGDRVLAVGNPVGLAFSVNQGIVSNNERSLLGVGYIQFDANVNPGNSGGPLVDMEGNAVGIVAMMVGNSAGLSFAIPINYLYEGSEPFLEPPEAKGHVERWQRFLARIKSADDKEAEAMTSAFRRPGLIAGVVSQRGIAALIARRNEAEPSSERMTFRVSEEGHELCSADTFVEGWRRMSSQSKTAMGDGRFFAWMQKHGISGEIWVGVARISVNDCSSPSSSSPLQLTLDGADPHADRVVLRRGSS